MSSRVTLQPVVQLRAEEDSEKVSVQPREPLLEDEWAARDPRRREDLLRLADCENVTEALDDAERVLSGCSGVVSEVRAAERPIELKRNECDLQRTQRRRVHKRVVLASQVFPHCILFIF